MCYFVSIGAKAPVCVLAEVFDAQADLDVAASPAGAPIARAFPVDDHVCLVTSRGCSCDLLAPSNRPSAVGSRSTRLTAAFQGAVLRVARQLGSIRLLVHRHRDPGRLPAPGMHLTLTAHEFMNREHWFVEDVVMEIAGGESSSPLAFS